MRAYAGLAEVEVVAVADADRDRAWAIAPPGASVHADLAALLADDRVAIVHVATPPVLHGPMALEALASGRHVFVEKPLATSLAEAEAVIREAVDRGLTVSVDYVLRHHPLHRLAIGLASAGVMGEPVLWSLENFASAEKLGPGHWFWDRRLSGGVHVEHGVHFFDLCQQVAGPDRPSEVSGWSQASEGRVDRVGATVRYGEGLAATFAHAFVRSDWFERTTVRIGLRRGQIELDGWIPTTLRLSGAASERELRMLGEAFGPAMRVGQSFDESWLAGDPGDGGGRLIEVSAELRRPDRWADYAAAVRAGMRELVAAVRGGPAPSVSTADALLSLETALRATE